MGDCRFREPCPKAICILPGQHGVRIRSIARGLNRGIYVKGPRQGKKIFEKSGGNGVYHCQLKEKKPLAKIDAKKNGNDNSLDGGLVAQAGNEEKERI